jgi:hypothetical protein
MLDSYVSRQFPTIDLKNRRTFALFTSKAFMQWQKIKINDILISTKVGKENIEMSEQTESYFIPYEESGHPEKGKRIKDLARESRIALPENYTLKKCEAYIRPEQTCAQPAKWVRMSIDQDLGHLTELAVCDEHKVDKGWTEASIPVKGERNIMHKDGGILYFLTVQDDIIGEFTVQVWLNQSSGQLSPMIINEEPSFWLTQLQKHAKKTRTALVAGTAFPPGPRDTPQELF